MTAPSTLPEAAEAMSFVNVVEVGGVDASHEQVMRTHHRYYWAADFCRGKDVLEAACGSGIGLPYLSRIASRLEAGDYDPDVLAICKNLHGDVAKLSQFDAEALPFADASFDVIILYEAIYYLKDAGRFASEARRVLRPGGRVLIASANSRLYDFTPSPHSTRYLNVTDFAAIFGGNGFTVSCFGYISVKDVPWRQKVLRPLKALASKLRLIPQSMVGKVWLKRIFFGSLTRMPPAIKAGAMPYEAPVPLRIDRDDAEYKTIYCLATLRTGVEKLSNDSER